MDSRHKVGTKGCMNGAMARDSAHRGQRRGLHGDPEMGLAPLTPAAMSPVLFAFIRHGKHHRGEGFGQTGMYFIDGSHFRLSTPSIPRKKP